MNELEIPEISNSRNPIDPNVPEPYNPHSIYQILKVPLPNIDVTWVCQNL